MFFLLAAGLMENITELQNNKSLTFLYRAPKITLDELNIISIAHKYKDIFSLDKEESYKMAKTTKGYAYAYQILGYLCFEHNKKYTGILDYFDEQLAQYSYEKYILIYQIMIKK